MVIKLVKTGSLTLEAQKFIRQCFAYKRKTLLNNLRKVYPEQKIKAVFKILNFGEKVRAEELNAPVFLNLYDQLTSNV